MGRKKVEGRQDGRREELVKARRAQPLCEAQTRQELAKMENHDRPRVFDVLFHLEGGVVRYPTNIHLPQDFGLVH